MMPIGLGKDLIIKFNLDWLMIVFNLLRCFTARESSASFKLNNFYQMYLVICGWLLIHVGQYLHQICSDFLHRYIVTKFFNTVNRIIPNNWRSRSFQSSSVIPIDFSFRRRWCNFFTEQIILVLHIHTIKNYRSLATFLLHQ